MDPDFFQYLSTQAKKEKSSDTEEEKNPRVKEIEKVKKAHPGVFDFSNDKVFFFIFYE